jgi:hypothetical protein
MRLDYSPRLSGVLPRGDTLLRNSHLDSCMNIWAFGTTMSFWALHRNIGDYGL